MSSPVRRGFDRVVLGLGATRDKLLIDMEAGTDIIILGPGAPRYKVLDRRRRFRKWCKRFLLRRPWLQVLIEKIDMREDFHPTGDVFERTATSGVARQGRVGSWCSSVLERNPRALEFLSRFDIRPFVHRMIDQITNRVHLDEFSHALPVTFVRSLRLKECQICDSHFSLSAQPRQVECGHIICEACLMKEAVKKIRKCPWCEEPLRELRILDIPAQAASRETPYRSPLLFRDQLGKAIEIHRSCEADPEYVPIAPSYSHSHLGCQRPIRSQSLSPVDLSDKHRLSIAAMVLLGLPTLHLTDRPAFQRDRPTSLWLGAVWQAIDSLKIGQFYDTHEELNRDISHLVWKAVNKIKPFPYEGGDMAVLQVYLTEIIQLAASFGDRVSLTCMEDIEMNAGAWKHMVFGPGGIYDVLN